MLRAFYLQPKHLHLSIKGSNPTMPFRVSGNFMRKGTPQGIILRDGTLYGDTPNGLPNLYVRNDGGASIGVGVTARDLGETRFAFSGTCELIKDGKVIEEIHSPFNLHPDKEIYRVGFGICPSGELIVVKDKTTLSGLKYALEMLGALDAMQGDFGEDILFTVPREGIDLMGTTLPVTVMEAVGYHELKHPIIVLDAGHGGRDPGAKGTGLKEKDVNLHIAKRIYMNLLRYDCTVLMTRTDDETIELHDRTRAIKAVKADMVLSIHSNAFNKEAHGYEDFTYHGADKEAVAMQVAIHNAMMDYLTPFGIKDRGIKQKNLHMVREPHKAGITSVLVENLFIDNPNEGALLADFSFRDGIGDVLASAMIKELGLKKIMTQDEGDDKQLYRVQTGAFRNHKYAKALKSKLEKDGYDAYIVKY